jgi:hypothetical protein
MRFSVWKPLLLSAALAVSVNAGAQTVVEHSLATGAMGTAAAGGSKGASKAIGGVFGNLSKTLDKAGSADAGEPASATSETIVTSKPASRRDGAAQKPGDPSKIRVGMTRATVIQTVGKPMMKTSRVEGTTFVETLYYQGPDDVVVVTLREGKVAEVVPPPPDSKESAKR